MSLRVLLVEDSHADALVAEGALQVSDGEFVITITGSLGAGIDRFVQGFDVILLDLTLPDSAGTETVARMRTAARDVPIVALTSAVWRRDRRRLHPGRRRRLPSEGAPRSERALRRAESRDRMRACFALRQKLARIDNPAAHRKPLNSTAPVIGEREPVVRAALGGQRAAEGRPESEPEHHAVGQRDPFRAGQGRDREVRADTRRYRDIGVAQRVVGVVLTVRVGEDERAAVQHACVGGDQ
jgi:CheY-like chemotaxis protein